MVDIKLVADHIYHIDDEVYGIKGWGGVYLLDDEKKALVDTGPTNSAPVVLEGMKKVGVRPEDISYIIATHIHLDHAGGVGKMLTLLPNAQLIVHPRGAKHLVDPSRLVASMIAVQGADIKIFGDMVPVKPERVRTAAEGDTIDIGCEQQLHVMDAPGHAPHELFIHENRNNGVFTGDGAGTLIGEVALPLTPPPNFDAEVYRATLNKLAEREPSHIYFAHFGATTQVKEHLEKITAVMDEDEAIISMAVGENKTAGLQKRMITWRQEQVKSLLGDSPAANYVLNEVIPLNVAGYLKYYADKHGVVFS